MVATTKYNSFRVTFFFFKASTSSVEKSFSEICCLTKYDSYSISLRRKCNYIRFVQDLAKTLTP